MSFILLITPSQHWVFNNWSGHGRGTSSSLTITMDSDKNVVGNFHLTDYSLTITIEGEGTVEQEIIQSKTTEYPYETVVQLTPKPSEGWRFVEWGGDLSGNEAPILITITLEKDVLVRFVEPVFLGENGITIKCPNGEIGEIGVVNGVEYEVVDRELLEKRRNEGSDLTKTCVSLVSDMSNLFNDINFNQMIGNWDVSNVTTMSSMFRGTPFNRNISN